METRRWMEREIGRGNHTVLFPVPVLQNPTPVSCIQQEENLGRQQKARPGRKKARQYKYKHASHFLPLLNFLGFHL
jgi:hypothetical protein